MIYRIKIEIIRANPIAEYKTPAWQGFDLILSTMRVHIGHTAPQKVAFSSRFPSVEQSFGGMLGIIPGLEMTVTHKFGTGPFLRATMLSSVMNKKKLVVHTEGECWTVSS
jgi:hypothetical protein